MALVVHIFQDEQTPVGEGMSFQLLADGAVIAAGTTNRDGTVVFQCDVAPSMKLALRLDADKLQGAP